MTSKHEYEVLKRHDVYVVRKVGSDVYAIRDSYCSIDGGFMSWWDIGPKDRAYGFSWKWRAILHARSLERADAYLAKCKRNIEARKSATEERVWR